MTDITTPLTELRAAYRAYQNAKRDKKEEIQEKYRTRMEDEIRSAVEAEKYAFASLLKDRKDFFDLKVSDIQDHVLRTRNWKVWEDIRDYADIAPESIVRRNAKADRAEEERRAALLFEWIDGVLHVYRNVVTKAELPHVVKYPLYNAKGVYIPSDVNQMTYLTELVGDRSQGFKTEEAATEEVKRAFEAGELTKSTHPYDYVNQLDNSDRAEYLNNEEAKFKAANPWLDEYTKETA